MKNCCNKNQIFIFSNSFLSILEHVFLFQNCKNIEFSPIVFVCSGKQKPHEKNISRNCFPGITISPKGNFGLSRRAKSIVRSVQRDKQTKPPRNRRQHGFQTVKVRYFWRERRGVEFPCIYLFLVRLRIKNIERETSKSASSSARTARAFTSKQLTLRLPNARLPLACVSRRSYSSASFLRTASCA